MKRIVVLLAVLLLISTGCALRDTRDPLSGYCEEGEEAQVICVPIEDEEVDEEKEEVDEEKEEVDEEKEEVDEEKEEVDEEKEEVDEEKEEVDEEKPTFREDVNHAIERTYEEGDLVSFADIEAMDPDGRDVTITFGYPLNEMGEWQTQEGDAGKYTIEIIASDGIDETKAYVLAIVEQRRIPPEIVVDETITVLEGEEVFIDVRVIDHHDSDIKITFSGWMDSPRYQTTYDDAGEYTVTITASDGIEEVSKDVTVVVVEVNRPPVIEMPTFDIVAIEGELIELDLNIYDPDGDDVTVTYSEPFDNEGKWQTERGDAGTYDVVVRATDGEETTTVTIPVVVEVDNQPPVLEVPEVIEVDEGETVFIEVEAYDPDGDEVTITFSGWMDSDTYTTNFDDAGTYIVTVTASDGIDQVSKDVTIIVNDVNRPPVFIWD